jgi:hypothetical protein
MFLPLLNAVAVAYFHLCSVGALTSRVWTLDSGPTCFEFLTVLFHVAESYGVVERMRCGCVDLEAQFSSILLCIITKEGVVIGKKESSICNPNL